MPARDVRRIAAAACGQHRLADPADRDCIRNSSPRGLRGCLGGGEPLGSVTAGIWAGRVTGTNQANQRVAIAGFGAIGMRIARALDAGISGYVLAAVSAHDRAKATKRLSGLSRAVPVVSIEE